MARQANPRAAVSTTRGSHCNDRGKGALGLLFFFPFYIQLGAPLFSSDDSCYTTLNYNGVRYNICQMHCSV